MSLRHALNSLLSTGSTQEAFRHDLKTVNIVKIDQGLFQLFWEKGPGLKWE